MPWALSMRWWGSVQRSRRHPQYFEYHGLAGREHMVASCKADLFCILHHLLMSIALEARDPWLCDPDALVQGEIPNLVLLPSLCPWSVTWHPPLSLKLQVFSLPLSKWAFDDHGLSSHVHSIPSPLR